MNCRGDPKYSKKVFRKGVGKGDGNLKRKTFLILALLMVSLFVFSGIAFANEADFGFDSDTGTITGYTGPGGDVMIPSQIGGVSVVSIGNKAFINCHCLDSLTIPTTVTSIGNQAFINCTGLNHLTIPNSVTSIGEYAFCQCVNLSTVIFEGFVHNISFSSDVFMDTNIKSFEFKDGTTKIPNYIFKYCTSLTSVTIPNSVTSIGEYAFESCTSLTSITIPNSVTSIGECAFCDCTSLTSVTIPNSVTSIGAGAFSHCTGLTNATIPDSVTSISDYTFYRCTSLSSIEIPNNVHSIGGCAFAECGFVSITIPNSINTVGFNSFGGCANLKNVTIENGVTSIGDAAFCWNASLENVTIPGSVTSIGYGSFYGCSGLTSVTIPNSVTSIGDYAFYCCTSLTSITIQNKETAIYDSANTISSTATIRGYDPSTAKKYADKYSRNFEEITPKGTVTIHYQDSEGNILKDSDIYTNVKGTQTYTAPDIEGYTKPAIDSVTYTITIDEQIESHTFVYSKVIALEGLNIIPAQATIEVGDTIQYKVELVYSDGTRQNIVASDVNWSIIQGDSLIFITNGGLLTALNTGSAKIGATYIDTDMNLFSAYADVTIIAPVVEGTVTIKYQDINGNTIKSSDVYENVTGENTYYAPNINGYELIRNNSVTFIISTNGQSEEHIFIYSIKTTPGGDSGTPPKPDPIVEDPKDPVIEEPKDTEDSKDPEVQEDPEEEPVIEDPEEEPKIPENPEEPEEPGVEKDENPIKDSENTSKQPKKPKNQDPVNNTPEKTKPAEVINDSNKTGSVAGRIIKDDGTPMSNVKVELHSEIRTTFTNQNGEFKFRNVPLGTHKLYLVDDQLKSGKALIGKIKVIANTNNVTPLNNKAPEQGIAQCVLADDKPVADLVIKVDTRQLAEESRKPTIFGSINPALVTTAVAALAATLLVILIPRRRRKKEE